MAASTSRRRPMRSGYRPVSMAERLESRFLLATYYVATSGSDSSSSPTNPGTPWQTIQKAATVVNPGDTVIVSPGVYYGPVVLTRAGTSSQPITFKADAIAQNRVIITNANKNIREKSTTWTLENSSLNLYSVPLSHNPARVLYDGVDLLPYASLTQLQNFKMGSELLYPGFKHGFAWSNNKLYVRLRADGLYGSSNPNNHVMAVSPAPGGGGKGHDTSASDNSKFNFAVDTNGPAHVILDGFSYETPGIAGVYIRGSNVTVKNSWFRGAKVGVSGGTRSDNSIFDSNNITLEYNDYSQFPSYTDAMEIIEENWQTWNYEEDKWKFFWWQKKGESDDLWLQSDWDYETGGLASRIGGNWTIRNNRIDEVFDGLSYVAMDRADGVEIYNNVFNKAMDNAIELENHAKNVKIYGNEFIDQFMPISWQPRGGTPWPTNVYMYKNLIRQSNGFGEMWRDKAKYENAWLKIGATKKQWEWYSWMQNVPTTPVNPGEQGLWFYNNTIVTPASEFLEDINYGDQTMVGTYFYNNVVVCATWYGNYDIPSNYWTMTFSHNLRSTDTVTSPITENRIAGTGGVTLTNPANVGFVNYSAGNYALTSSSPARGLGVAVPNRPSSEWHTDAGAIPYGSSWTTPTVGPQGTSGLPAAPSGLNASAVSNSQINLTWTDNASNETGFAIDYSTSSTFASGVTTITISTANTTSRNVTGLSGGTTYYFRVRATNGSGASANSSTASATTQSGVPSAPTGLAATPGNAQVSLSWNTVSGATSYNVKRSTTNGGSYSTIASNVTQTSFSDTGLTNGTTYYYVVSAVNGSGEGSNSGQVSATPAVPAPVDVYQAEDHSIGGGSVTESSNGGFNGSAYINFPSSGGFLEFTNVNGNGGGAKTITFRYALGVAGTRTGLLIVNGNSQNITFSSTGAWTTWQTHNVNVTLNNSSSNTIRLESNGQDLANIDELHVPQSAPSAPSGLTATTASSSQINLAWTDNASNETGFAVDYSTSSTFASGVTTIEINSVDATSHNVTGLTAGTTYYFRVRAVNGIGNSSNSGAASATTHTGVPTAPTGLAAVAGNAQVSLSWTGSSGATSYKIKRSTTSGGPYTTIASDVTSTTFNSTGLTNGTIYYYVVSAVNAAGESPDSSQVTATPTAPASYDIIQAETASIGGGAVVESTNSGFNSTGYVNFALDGSYLQFNSVDGNGGGVKTIRFRYALGVPTARTGALIVNGVSQPITFESTGAWTTWQLFSVPVTLTSGTANTIRLETNGQDLANIDELQIPQTASTPSVPTGLSATAASSSQINLAWTDNANNETGFKVDYSTSSTFAAGVTTVTIATANTTSFNVTGLSPGTTYYFRVRAYNGAGDSAHSSAANATTQAASSNVSIPFSSSSDYSDNFREVGGYTSNTSWHSTGVITMSHTDNWRYGTVFYDTTPGDGQTTRNTFGGTADLETYQLDFRVNASGGAKIFARVANPTANGGYYLWADAVGQRLALRIPTTATSPDNENDLASQNATITAGNWYTLQLLVQNSGSSVVLTGKLFAQGQMGTPLATVSYTHASSPYQAAGQVGFAASSSGNSAPTTTTNIDNFVINAPTGGGASVVAPTVTHVLFDKDTPATPPSLLITFSEPMQQPTAADFSIIDLNSSGPIPFEMEVVDPTHVKITFSGANGAPPDGNLQLSIAPSVRNLAGQSMAATHQSQFAFLQADANTDGAINTLDFNVLAGNFGSGQSFSGGDFDFDGVVNSIDFNIFSSQYGKKLPSAPSAAAPLFARALGGAALFGQDKVIEDVLV